MALYILLLTLHFFTLFAQPLVAKMPGLQPSPVETEEDPTEGAIPDGLTALVGEKNQLTDSLSNDTKTTAGKDKSPVSDEKKRNDIYLNFENSSLANVVNYIAELRQINLLPDKGLDDVKVSLTIREPLTVDGAWNIFLTLLEVSGFSIVEVGGLHKVMAKEKKLTEALPIYINVPYTTLPNSDLTVRYVVFLQNLQLDSVKDLLESLLSDKHILYSYAQANCFIITDRCYNIKSAMKVIHELDAMGQPETVVVMNLRRTNATDVKALIEGLMSKKADNNPLARFFAKPIESTTEYFPSNTKIVAEERTNSLILMGAPEPIKKIQRFIQENIDVDLKTAESPLHIYECQYADASALADILNTVTAPPDQGPGQQAAKYGAIRGGVKYFKSMKFQVDKDANRLIVSCTDKQDWQLLLQILKDLDKPQPQVAIEALYVAITEEDIKQMGGSIRNKKEGQLSKGLDFQSANLGAPTLSDANTPPVTLLGNMLSQLSAVKGSTLLTFGQATNIWAIFQMIKSCSNSSIISQPFITVANKVTGKITVGSENNVEVEKTDTGLIGYGTVNADTSLEITPQINLDGVIRLKINVSISEFTDPVLGNKSVNTVTTDVSMADGQVLVLGGFVQTKVSESTDKTPLLGDIPLFGWFFKNQTRQVNRSYIFIFMAPTIVKPRTSPGVELYSKMKLHQATSEIEDGIKTSKANDPVFNWFFDPKGENYSHKVVDFANARYQPTTVDIKHDPYYRSNINDMNEKNMPVFSHPVGSAPTMMASKNVNKSRVIPTQPQLNSNSAQAMAQQGSIKEISSQERISSPFVQQVQAPELNSDNIKSFIDNRLELSQESIIQSPTRMIEPRQQSVADNQFETGAPTENSEEKVSQSTTKQNVLNVLTERMQKQRHISVDNDQLDSQRKKLKSLIAQSFASSNNTTEQAAQPSSEKQEALKNFLTVPSINKSVEQQNPLAIDRAKRNSLKDFLSRAEQQQPTTRNNPV